MNEELHSTTAIISCHKRTTHQTMHIHLFAFRTKISLRFCRDTRYYFDVIVLMEERSKNGTKTD